MRKLLAMLGVLGVLVSGGGIAAQEKSTPDATCTLKVKGMT